MVDVLELVVLVEVFVEVSVVATVENECVLLVDAFSAISAARRRGTAGGILPENAKSPVAGRSAPIDEAECEPVAFDVSVSKEYPKPTRSPTRLRADWLFMLPNVLLVSTVKEDATLVSFQLREECGWDNDLSNIETKTSSATFIQGI